MTNTQSSPASVPVSDGSESASNAGLTPEKQVDRNWREYGQRVIEDPARARHSAMVVLLLIAVLSMAAGFTLGALVAGLAGWRF